MRFVPPVAALADGAGRASTATRTCGSARSARCSTALRALGVRRSTAAARCRSRSTAPARCRGGTVVIDASASSQFVSALLLAGARYDEGVDVRHDGKPVPSLPHIEMTVAMLREHGVEVDDSRRQPLGGRARAGRGRRPR